MENLPMSIYKNKWNILFIGIGIFTLILILYETFTYMEKTYCSDEYIKTCMIQHCENKSLNYKNVKCKCIQYGLRKNPCYKKY